MAGHLGRLDNFYKRKIVILVYIWAPVCVCIESGDVILAEQVLSPTAADDDTTTGDGLRKGGATDSLVTS